MLVLDEAWRLVSSPFLTPLMLEGRSFGLGVIVATQFPRQLSEEISGSTATRLFFGQTKAEQIRDIQRTLVGKTSGSRSGSHWADNPRSRTAGVRAAECTSSAVGAREGDALLRAAHREAVQRVAATVSAPLDVLESRVWHQPPQPPPEIKRADRANLRARFQRGGNRRFGN